MLEEYGDDLAVIFVESQGANAKRAESFAYDRGWMGRGAYWTLERPASTGLGYLPSFILLDVDGKVLLKGNTGSMKGKIKDAIKDQIKDARDLPEEYGKDFKKAWKALVEDDWAKAIELIAKEAEDGGENASQAASMSARLEARIESDYLAIERRIELGYFVEALERAEAFAEQTEEIEKWSTAADELLTQLRSESLTTELEADQAFTKVYESVCEDGVEDNERALGKFASKYAGTKAAARAEHLLSLID